MVSAFTECGLFISPTSGVYLVSCVACHLWYDCIVSTDVFDLSLTYRTANIFAHTTYKLSTWPVASFSLAFLILQPIFLIFPHCSSVSVSFVSFYAFPLIFPTSYFLFAFGVLSPNPSARDSSLFCAYFSLSSWFRLRFCMLVQFHFLWTALVHLPLDLNGAVR